MLNAAQINEFTLHLAELRSNLSKFHQLLKTESECLKKNDTDALIPLLNQKQNLAEHISDSLAKITSEHKLSNNVSELLNFCKTQNLASSSQQTAQEIIELTEQCKQLNMRNGLTIQAIENINLQMLNLLTQQQKGDVNLYNSSGETHASHNKATLGKA